MRHGVKFSVSFLVSFFTPLPVVTLHACIHAQLFDKRYPQANFMGSADHAELTEHKIFINPSKSEVVCTTNLEALAMGKFVIAPVHPSNEFFMKFTNFLSYTDKDTFLEKLEYGKYVSCHFVPVCGVRNNCVCSSAGIP